MKQLLHGDNKFAAVMQMAEEKTGLKREYFFYAVLAVPAVVVALLVGGDLLLVSLALLYPGMKTVEALEKNIDPKQWLAFWVVLCVSVCVGWFVDALFFWLPGLFWIKLAYILWLLAPQPYSGTVIIYGSLIAPHLRQILPQLRSKMDTIVSAGRSFTSPRGKSQASEGQEQRGSSFQVAGSQAAATAANRASQQASAKMSTALSAGQMSRGSQEEGSQRQSQMESAPGSQKVSQLTERSLPRGGSGVSAGQSQRSGRPSGAPSEGRPSGAPSEGRPSGAPSDGRPSASESQEAPEDDTQNKLEDEEEEEEED